MEFNVTFQLLGTAVVDVEPGKSKRFNAIKKAGEELGLLPEYPLAYLQMIASVRKVHPKPPGGGKKYTYGKIDVKEVVECTIE